VPLGSARYNPQTKSNGPLSGGHFVWPTRSSSTGMKATSTMPASVAGPELGTTMNSGAYAKLPL
jgi:hypothetical protein